jgi:hypothetical protein
LNHRRQVSKSLESIPARHTGRWLQKRTLAAIRKGFVTIRSCNQGETNPSIQKHQYRRICKWGISVKTAWL